MKAFNRKNAALWAGAVQVDVSYSVILYKGNGVAQQEENRESGSVGESCKCLFRTHSSSLDEDGEGSDGRRARRSRRRCRR